MTAVAAGPLLDSPPQIEAGLFRRILAEARPGSRYAGVGSRETPADILQLMTKIAVQMRSRGITLRSGGAIGADHAFEAGAGDQKEIYLPWKGYENSTSSLWRIPDAAMALAIQHHPRGAQLTPGQRKMMARNAQQVLGADCASPSSCVICWTPDGATSKTSRATGGTGQAIRIAFAHGIPVFNLALPQVVDEISAALNLLS